MEDGHNTSTLTPLLRSLAVKEQPGKRCTINQLRDLVTDCTSKGLYVSAALYAERLTRFTGNNIADIIAFARCYLLSGEHRRCLAILEQKGLLSASIIRGVSDSIRPTAVINLQDLNESSTVKCEHINLVGIQLAAQCLFSLEQYEDCISLLDPLLVTDDEANSVELISLAKAFYETDIKNRANTINTVASVYCIAGRCYDTLDNRSKALKALTTAIKIDTACIEAVEYISVNGMMSKKERVKLYNEMKHFIVGREWLDGFYRFILLDDLTCTDMDGDKIFTNVGNNNDDYDGKGGLPPEFSLGSTLVSQQANISALWLTRKAEHSYEQQQPEEAYRMARQAYTIDPFDWRGLLVYIASMVDLKLKTELFYLGHELSNTYPKNAISWYAVGCYYYCCNKLEMAQKYLIKATKIDKRFSKAWIILGNVLALQEESEHAISAFRTASRLLPGDHRPLVFMAKELVRTNYLPLALHILVSAVDISPMDPNVLNELGVVYMRLDRLDESYEALHNAVVVTQSLTSSTKERLSSRKGYGEEVFNNYATLLRKLGKFEEALTWYDLCLAINPVDAGTHANTAFTLHLLERFDEAINSYHRALSLQPTYTFCSEMLTRALEDSMKKEIYNTNNMDNVDDKTNDICQPFSPNSSINMSFNASTVLSGLGDESIYIGGRLSL